jgi:mono/diheme cytochrome c family protein
MTLIAAGILAFALAAGGFLSRIHPLRTIRIPALIVGAVLVVGGVLQPPATPESGLANPVPRIVDSVAAGAGLFRASCAVCHGVDAHGGGTAAGTTAVRPPALAGPEAHLSMHTDGDLHYWIANGLPGGMPAWSTRLDDAQIWHLINFLRSLNGEPVESARGAPQGAP